MSDDTPRMAHRYRMQLKDVLACFPMRSPTKEQILGAVFGPEAYIGPYAAIEAPKVLSIAFLRFAHAVVYFEGGKAWQAFCEIMSSDDYAPRVSPADGIWLVPPEQHESTNLLALLVNGRYMSVLHVTEHAADGKYAETYDLLDEYNGKSVEAAMAKPTWSTMLSLVDVHHETLRQIDVYRKQQSSKSNDPTQSVDQRPFETGAWESVRVRDDAPDGGDRSAGDGGPAGQD